MSRYYRELHDRELLAQAAIVLREVQDRKLLDVYLPPDAQMPGEDTAVFPRRLAGVSVNKGRLTLAVEPRFFKGGG
jgi:hypothetical protein